MEATQAIHQDQGALGADATQIQAAAACGREEVVRAGIAGGTTSSLGVLLVTVGEQELEAVPTLTTLGRIAEIGAGIVLVLSDISALSDLPKRSGATGDKSENRHKRTANHVKSPNQCLLFAPC
jgi:hypothetical protein